MEKQIKAAKIILIVYGAILAFFGIWSLFEKGLMHITSSHMHAESVWIILMPALSIIGLAYLIFGINLHKIQKRKLTIHLIISGVSLIWFTLYVIAFFTGNTFSNKHTTYPEGTIRNVIEIAANIFDYLSIIISLAVIIIPQIIIGKKLYKVEKKSIPQSTSN